MMTSISMPVVVTVLKLRHQAIWMSYFILAEPEENDECLIHIPHSPYIDINSIANGLQPKKDNFSILSLNAQRLVAKFNELSLLVTELKETGFTFGVICIQETWFQSNQDTSLFNLDDYNLEYVISSCSTHGGVACYIH